MNIQKARERRVEVEKKIMVVAAREINRFQEETGLQVEWIRINLEEVTTIGRKPRQVVTDVNLDVRL